MKNHAIRKVMILVTGFVYRMAAAPTVVSNILPTKALILIASETAAEVYSTLIGSDVRTRDVLVLPPVRCVQCSIRIGGSRKSSTNVSYLRKARTTSHAYILKIQALSVLCAIGMHPQGADVTWSAVDLESWVRKVELLRRRSWSLTMYLV